MIHKYKNKLGEIYKHWLLKCPFTSSNKTEEDPVVQSLVFKSNTQLARVHQPQLPVKIKMHKKVIQ